jgi:hypothetical protein
VQVTAAGTVRMPAAKPVPEDHDHLAPSIHKFTGKLKPLEAKKSKTAAAASQASQKATPAPPVSTTDDTEDAPDDGTSAPVRKLH